MTSAPKQLDCFTIALGKKTGTTFPITFDNKHNYNALYDTGAGASLINYSAYVCRVTTRPPRPSSTAECLCLIARLRGEQASAASWEPRPPFEATEMD